MIIDGRGSAAAAVVGGPGSPTGDVQQVLKPEPDGQADCRKAALTGVNLRAIHELKGSQRWLPFLFRRVLLSSLRAAVRRAVGVGFFEWRMNLARHQ